MRNPRFEEQKGEEEEERWDSKLKKGSLNK